MTRSGGIKRNERDGESANEWEESDGSNSGYFKMSTLRRFKNKRYRRPAFATDPPPQPPLIQYGGVGHAKQRRAHEIPVGVYRPKIRARRENIRSSRTKTVFVERHITRIIIPDVRPILPYRTRINSPTRMSNG